MSRPRSRFFHSWCPKHGPIWTMRNDSCYRLNRILDCEMEGLHHHYICLKCHWHVRQPDPSDQPRSAPYRVDLKKDP
jgi:hypothetical protein